MAMNKDTLGTAIMNEIGKVSDKTNREAVFRAMAKAIIDHIQDFAEVNTNVDTTVSTTGTASAQTGTGKGKGKGKVK